MQYEWAQKLWRWMLHTDTWLVLDGYVYIRFAYFVGAVAFALIWYKFWRSTDGNFRRKLLYFWGAGVFRYLVLAFTYHPFFNYWLSILAGIPFWLASLWLAGYIVRFYGIAGRFAIVQHSPKHEAATLLELRELLQRLEIDRLRHDWAEYETPPAKDEQV